MEAVGSLCKCICSGLFTQYGGSHFARQSLEFEEELPFHPPLSEDKVMYSTTSTQALRGVPIRESAMWHITSEDHIEEIHFSLYINGFSFARSNVYTGLGTEESISLNPFTLVRNCKFQCQYGAFEKFKIFKISLFPQGQSYYFGLKEDNERTRWVLDISHAIRLVTQSLFPSFRIRCDPIDSVPVTHRRLMAGYLLHLAAKDVYSTTLLYCELHAHFNDHAKLVLYTNEQCNCAVLEIPVTITSVCCEKVGINCSCFCFEDHNFSSRTLSERKLWLRAFSNVKVKLQNSAPTPSAEQIFQYRQAIKEHVADMMVGLESPLMMDPLLQRVENGHVLSSVHISLHTPTQESSHSQ